MLNTQPKYPQAVVHLTLTENAFEIMGTVQKALRNAGATKEELSQNDLSNVVGQRKEVLLI